MEGYSSGGSASSFFTSQMTNEFECLISDKNSWSFPEYNSDLWDNICMDYWKWEETVDLTATSNRMLHSQINQHQPNEGEMSEEGSCQTQAGGVRVKLTPAQKRENKRQSDYLYRQKLKRIAAEQTAENKHLKVENERLNAENRELKALFDKLLTCHTQLLEEGPQGHHTCILQSTCKQLHHQSVSVQPAVQISSLEMNDSANLHEKIPINAVATDTPIAELMKKIDANDGSNIFFSDFTGLEGERIKVGKYSFPLSLHPVAERIINVYGDVSETSKMNLIVAEATYILFCASVKEMDDLQLEQLTEDRILKWRDAIRDALRINFKVEFAMDHLKRIAQAYIGHIERQKQENMNERISKLETAVNTIRQEHAKREEMCKKYMDAAEEFNGKSLSPFP